MTDTVENVMYEASTMRFSFGELGADEQRLLAETFRSTSLSGEPNRMLSEVYLTVPDEVVLSQKQQKHQLPLRVDTEGRMLTGCKVLTNTRPGEAYHWLVEAGVFTWPMVHVSQIEFPVEEEDGTE